MSDPIVQRGQLWLNATYGSNPSYSYVEPNGLHGSAMSAALVSAMQIELGTPVTGVFGDITKAACDSAPLKPGDSGNRVKIMQYGFYNKGYNAGTEDGAFNSFTKAVVREIQEDAGLSGSQISDQVDGLRMSAILGVDEYKLVPGGDVTVRTIQKVLNQRFVAYTGLKACDGHYGRSTNEALIYAIQALEGMSTDMATGFFGPSTKNYLPDLWQPGQWGMNGGYSAAEIADFTRIAQYALYCVGIDRYSGGSGSKYNPGTMDGSQSSGTLAALHAFQNDYALSQRDMVGLDEWMGLLVSTGNPNRDGLACDCATQLTTPNLVASLYNDDYRIVGRYLTGTVGGGADKKPKNLTSTEIQTIFAGGMKLFCIFQDDADWWQNHSNLSGYFSQSRGYRDAQKAVSAAIELGIPKGEYIYFAVDYDFMEGEVHQKVVPHFHGIASYMDIVGNPYRIGIYSARNTCGIVSAQNLASSSFVSDMSTGYSGNLGYPLPSNWAFDQIQEYVNAAGFGIDKNVTSGRYLGFDRVDSVVDAYVPPSKPSISAGTPSIQSLVSTIQSMENMYRTYYQNTSELHLPIKGSKVARGVTNFMRQIKYADWQWDIVCDRIDTGFIEYVRTNNSYAYNQILQYINESSPSLTDGVGGEIDLAHLAATLEAYLSSIIPAYWSGWGADLATGMADVTDGVGSGSVLDAAYRIIGSTTSSCNYSDFCCDADAIALSAMISSDIDNTNPLSTALASYYAGSVSNRYEYILNEIGDPSSVSSLKDTIKAKMLADFPFNGIGMSVIDLKGKTDAGVAPSAENIEASCIAAARYLLYRANE